MRVRTFLLNVSLLIALVLHVCPSTARAQNIYLTNTETTGYYIPELGETQPIPLLFILGTRLGTLFQSQRTGTKIYGMACVVPPICSDTFGTYFFLYKATPYSDYLVPVDSARLNDAIPTAGMLLSYIDSQGNRMDSIFPVVEYFFETPQLIEENSIFGLAIGPGLFDPNYSSSSTFYPGRSSIINVFALAESEYPNPNMPSTFDITVGFPFLYSNLRAFYGVFPITDSSLRITYEQELCKRRNICDITATYTSVRTFTLSWNDQGQHCLYEVAYGPDSIPVEEYNVITTTDTSITVGCLNYEDRMAFRVRAACCLDDTTLWGQWTDTVRFQRPFYTLNVYVNDTTLGEAPGSGLYEHDENILLVAQPYSNAVFSTWDDGDTNRIRELILTSDSSITAIFLPVEDTAHGGGNAIISAAMPQVFLSPNPASNVVNIISSCCVNSVTLYTVDGIEVYDAKVGAIGTGVNVASLPRGTYIVRVTTSRGQVFKKLILR